jgi:hypothetical protein
LSNGRSISASLLGLGCHLHGQFQHLLPAAEAVLRLLEFSLEDLCVTLSLPDFGAEAFDLGFGFSWDELHCVFLQFGCSLVTVVGKRAKFTRMQPKGADRARPLKSFIFKKII